MPSVKKPLPVSSRLRDEKNREPSKTELRSKVCLICGKNKLLKEFYPNKDWLEQGCTDKWCKSCANTLNSREDLLRYLWYNNRDMNPRIYEDAADVAKRMLEQTDAFNKEPQDVQERLIEAAAVRNCRSQIVQYYKFVDNTDGGRFVSYEEALKQTDKEAIYEEADDGSTLYSEEFNGEFTKKQLQYLADYYRRLEKDFNLDNESIRDYARKICKASLMADVAQDEFARGECDFSTVKDAVALFDMLSKSANFAACRRKQETATGLSSWSETTQLLESSGYTMCRKIEWEKDDVDKVIDNLRHLVRSVGLEK